MFRAERRRNEKTGATYPWLVGSTAMVNHFYIYRVTVTLAFLPKVQLVFSLQRQALHQRTRIREQQLAHKVRIRG